MKKLIVRIILNATLISTIAVFTTSCGAITKTAQNKLTVESKAIPPDFGKDDAVLICVLMGRNSFDKYLKKNISERYHGETLFLLEDELYDDKYDDTKKYRYTLSMSLLVKRTVDPLKPFGQQSEMINTTHFYMMDRLSDKVYKSPFTTSFFGKVAKAYGTNLEQLRLKGKE